MLSSEQRFLGHRVVHGFRRGGDDDGIDVVVLQERAVIRGRRDGLGLLRHFLQARLFDFGDVQFAHIGARGARFRANATAPSRSDDSDVDLLHVSSAQNSAIQGIESSYVGTSQPPSQAYMLADFSFRARHITTTPSGFGGTGFSVWGSVLASTKTHRLNRLRKNSKRCHSERSEESLLVFFLYLNRREILRFAQKDKTRHFFRSL